MSKEIKPFYYEGANGVIFTSKTCNFAFGVDVEVPQDVSMEQLLQDTTEMGIFHFRTIWETLDGFSGYDVVQYRIQKKKK